MQASQLQNRFEKIRSNKAFELFVIGVILFSALLVGAKTYDMPSTVNQITNLLDWFISAFFLVELTIRFLAERRKLDFFKSFWNWFDTIIVLVSLLPLENSDTALIARLVRVFRVLRMISIIPELRILLVSLMKALPQLGYVMLLMFIIFYIYAAIGSTLFEQINPVLWGDITISLLTLFRVMTFEDWTDHPNTFYTNKLLYTFDKLRKNLNVMSIALPFKMFHDYCLRSQNNRNQTIYL
ncbi:ion transporter [Marisediminitalea sp.]|uniref:ion transporter n=1 Tax=Marisediminitalea sp. TaxID=2662268 RepID=UPI003512C30D